MGILSNGAGVRGGIMAAVGGAKDRGHMVSRRDFLRVGSLSVVGLPVAEQAALARSRAAGGRRSCILILMTGGPSQFETFDPKPEAPSEIRGPLRPIATSVPGVAVSEGLPQLAKRAHQFSILRSVYHSAAPIHETGFQLLQTGRLAQGGRTFPSVGSVAARLLGPRSGAPPYVVLPGLLQDTGVRAYRGQGAGFWETEYAPIVPPSSQKASDVGRSNGPEESDLLRWSLAEESDSVCNTYGENPFGRLCLHARQLVERGVRFVTINLFDHLVNQVTWDCHANKPTAPGTLLDYRDRLCPQFDRALAALLDDLGRRGLLDETLVMAAGEFGRTPRLNANGGRDHWPGVWSALVAGGGVIGGQLIGASDVCGGSPQDRPVPLAELAATLYRGLGIDLKTMLVDDDGTETPLIEAEPIGELFATRSPKNPSQVS